MSKRAAAIVIAAGAVLLQTLILQAAWSDSKANSEARKRWGKLGAIARVRQVDATNWTYVAGLDTHGCAGQNHITPLGTSTIGFEQAFGQADQTPPAVAGPFKGVIKVRGAAFDNVAVAGFMWVVDNNDIWAADYTQAEAASWTFEHDYDTSVLNDGLHTICSRIVDNSGNVGRSRAIIFATDQTAGTANVAWRPTGPGFNEDVIDAAPGAGKPEFGN